MTVCTTFANGVQILSRALPGRRTAAVGLWLRGGIRGQRADQDGLAHLHEHLLFRGGGSAFELDQLGGYVNASTTRELTALHGVVTVPAQLAATFARRLTGFDAGGAPGEWSAVLNEIADARNDVSSAVEDEVIAAVWHEHPMARPILGDVRSLENCGREDVARFHRQTAIGQGVRVIAAGAVDHDALVESCRPLSVLPACSGVPRRERPPSFASRKLFRYLPGDRSIIGWVMPIPIRGSGHAAALLAERLASGASELSLVGELRDRLGLVYDVSSRLDVYSDCGLWWLQTSCDAREAEICRHAIESVFGRLIARVPRSDELLRALYHLRARWLIEDDDIEQVMERIAFESLFLGRVRSLDERLAALSAVSAEQVAVTLAQCWHQRTSFAYAPQSAARRYADGAA